MRKGSKHDTPGGRKTRRCIMEHLSRRPLSVRDLSAACEGTRASYSVIGYHLQKLRDQGLVQYAPYSVKAVNLVVKYGEGRVVKHELRTWRRGEDHTTVREEALAQVNSLSSDETPQP